MCKIEAAQIEIAQVANEIGASPLQLAKFCCKSHKKSNEFIEDLDLKKLSKYIVEICEKIQSISEEKNINNKKARALAYKQASLWLLRKGYKQWANGHSLPLKIKCIISLYFNGKSTKENLIENIQKKC